MIIFELTNEIWHFESLCCGFLLLFSLWRLERRLKNVPCLIELYKVTYSFQILFKLGTKVTTCVNLLLVYFFCHFPKIAGWKMCLIELYKVIYSLQILFELGIRITTWVLFCDFPYESVVTCCVCGMWYDKSINIACLVSTIPVRHHAPPFQKIKWNPWNLVTTLQKFCFLVPTIFNFPQPNWR